MSLQEEAVEKRLSLYHFSKVFPNYLSQLQQIQSLVQRLLDHNLNENDQLSVEEVKNLRVSLEDKYLEAKNFVETERLSYNALDVSLERTVDNTKNGMESQLSVLRDLREELAERNDRLHQLHLDIADFNEESVHLNTHSTTLKCTKSEWINNVLEDEASFDKLLEYRVFKSVGNGLYSVTEELFDGEIELKRMNQLMKKDIDRLKMDLDDYKQKWLDNYDTMSKIGSIIKGKLNERSNRSEENEDDYEEEEEVIERIKKNDVYESEDDGEERSSFNTDEEEDEDEEDDEYGIEQDEEDINIADSGADADADVKAEIGENAVDSNGSAGVNEGENNNDGDADQEMNDA